MNLFIIVFGILTGVNYAVSDKIVLCYYGTWATYRHGLGKFDVEHIDSSLCTHLVYTFTGINAQGTVISLDPYLDLPDNWGRNNFGKFNSLKQKNPNLKTILAVGGWNEGSAKYSIMAGNPAFRKNFINSALDMILTHKFDGFDVDWEYPNRRDTVHGKADIDNFTRLLKELKDAFEPHGLLLTAAVASVRDMASLSYDIPAISQYLDIISIMAYDMYGAWDPVTGHNAPLHKGEGDDGVAAADLYTVDYALKYWIDQGCPVEKLVLGVPLYGRTFTLNNPSLSSVRAPASGPGIAGPFTATNGVIGYNELCSKLRTETWDVRFDELARVPYAVQGRNWISFDTADSLVEKFEYGLNYNIAGVMVWSIETDDFHGICHGETFPLLRALNRVASRAVVPSPTTTSAPTTTTTTTSATTTGTTTTSAPTTQSPVGTTPPTEEVLPASNVCQQAGYAPNPEDCSSFFKCVATGTGKFQATKFLCPANLHWDQSLHTCNYPSLVTCNI